jgi:hypothetical protein
MSLKYKVLAGSLAVGCVSGGWAQGAKVAGYVTRVGSAMDFSVDGMIVEATPDTVFLVAGEQGALTPVAPGVEYLGEYAKVSGQRWEKPVKLTAKKVILYPAVGKVRVQGTGVVDWVQGAGGTRRLFRVHGRLIDVSASDLKAAPASGGTAQATLAAQLSGDVRTNEWISYDGLLQADGTVALTWAEVYENAVKPGEGKLIRKTDFDPSTVTESDRQSKAARAFLGPDLKRIPAYKNEDEQARIDRIGRSLIPAFQKALPDSDPTKIDFRFQLVDEPKWRDAITLPSGVILVPRQIVERLTNDSQLAAVLADNIACALEKQDYRAQPTRRAMTGVQVAGALAGVFIPGASLATNIGTFEKGKSMLDAAEAQSGRVALGLMHDAGYDLTQAPEAWWTLAAKPGQNPHEKPAPSRANNQFQALGTTWRPTLQ